MRANAAFLSLSLLFGAAICSAQEPQQPAVMDSAYGAKSNTPDYSNVYCSGFFTDQKIPDEARLISGEQDIYKIVFARGEYVYLNQGADKGVKEGDRFMVFRQESDPLKIEWFKGETKLQKAMGISYSDLGHVRVVKVNQNTSIAQITFSCAYMQRGDIIRPYVERPVGPFKESGQFDHFAPVSGKPVAMVVVGREFAQSFGRGDAVYVNLGSSQGVKVGDYIRMFRYQGRDKETMPSPEGYQYKLFGFGSTPVRYKWSDLPREVLGEGIVLNTSKNSSTVLLTYSSTEIFAGDYAEIE